MLMLFYLLRKTRIRSSFSEGVSLSYTWDIKILQRRVYFLVKILYFPNVQKKEDESLLEGSSSFLLFHYSFKICSRNTCNDSVSLSCTSSSSVKLPSPHSTIYTSTSFFPHLEYTSSTVG